MASRDSFSIDPQSDAQKEVITDLQHVGQALQRAREAQGLTLHQLADALHMGDEQLKALETGDRDHLAETVFVRATVRRVASKLRLDPEPLIAALQSLDGPKPAHRQSGSGRTDASKTQTRPQQAPPAGRRKGWLRVATAATAVVATIAAGWSWGQSTLLRQAKDNEAAPSDTSSLGASKPLSQASAPINAASTSPQTLTIHTSEPSWIAVRNQDGEELFAGMLDKEKTFAASEGLEIYAGRPDLVSVKSAGNQQGPLGPIDQIRWYRISAAPEPINPTL